jgi:hypothetical protein
MNTFEQDMAESYKKLEKNMDYIASLFNFKKKGYMGENIMILDFDKKEFIKAQATASTWLSNMSRHHGWTNHEGIEFRPVLYSKNNRIAFTF